MTVLLIPFLSLNEFGRIDPKNYNPTYFAKINPYEKNCIYGMFSYQTSSYNVLISKALGGL